MPPQQGLPPQQPIYGAPQQPFGAPPAPYGAPPQQPYGQPQHPYGAPQAPYYYPGQQPPAYQQSSPWGSQWQAPQPPPVPVPVYQTPAPIQPDPLADQSAVAPATDQAATTDPAATDAAATDPGATTDPAAATATATAQAPAAPTVCLRCYAPLQPGYAGCGNCGFDNSIVWGALATPAGNRIPTVAYALALLGAGLIVAAVALVLVAAH